MMKHLLALILWLACVPLGYGMEYGMALGNEYGTEYGSTTLAVDRLPEAAIDRVSQVLCGKSGGLPSRAIQVLDQAIYVDVACEVDGRRIGVILARYADGRAYINYRLN